MLTYSIISISALALAVSFLFVQSVKKHPAGFIFILPFLLGEIYGCLNLVGSAPLALGVVSIVMMSIMALLLLAMIISTVMENGEEGVPPALFLLFVSINSIVYLSCVL